MHGMVFHAEPRDKVSAIIDEAFGIVRELELGGALAEIAFAKAIDLMSPKPVPVSDVAPQPSSLMIPRA
jgi:hypothetical protein